MFRHRAPGIFQQEAPTGSLSSSSGTGGARFLPINDLLLVAPSWPNLLVTQSPDL